MTSIIPVILCGGSGTRLWPLSRKSFPKQFVPLIDGKSLLQLTLKPIQLNTSAAMAIAALSAKNSDLLQLCPQTTVSRTSSHLQDVIARASEADQDATGH